jgi:hypothetical protein
MPVEQQISAPPRFGVIHLLTLTAGVALALAIQERMLELFRNGLNLQSFNMFQRAQLVFGSVLAGCALAGLFWLIHWRQRQGPFDFQPGHWIILSVALTMLVVSATHLMADGLIESNWPRQDRWLMMITQPLFYAVTCLVLALSVLRTTGIWRWLMAVWLFSALGQTLTSIAMISGSSQELLMAAYYGALIFKLLPIVLLPAAVIWDLWRKTSRDWIHYWGIILPAGTFVSEATSTVYYRFFYP